VSKKKKTVILKERKDDKWKTSGKKTMQFFEINGAQRRSGSAWNTRMCEVVK